MNAADILRSNQILRAAEVIELAAATGLDLACAVVLLVKESGGGYNVWGHDAVPTGGAYDKGGPVTRENYQAYKTAVREHRAGRQGCGPTQLTYGPYQDQADAGGGCWDWRTNCFVGFQVLARLIAQYGEREGFRKYNGVGPAAERYADDAVTRLVHWRALLARATTPPPGGDMALTDDDARKIADAVWTAAIVNAFGDRVSISQVLNGVEKRVADVQATLAVVRDRLGG